MSPGELSKTFSISPNKASLFYSELHNVDVRKEFKADLERCKIITLVDEDYPAVLNTIKDAPLVLYAIGDVSLLEHSPALSVIGTRNPSIEAWMKISHLVEPLLEKDWLIVSGMALGIDSYAHTLALEKKGKTIAVLGSGFLRIYPVQNKALFRKIAKEGLILSEYPPNTPPQKYHFPERNRIISGLSFGTLVIEAKERSGTLITVDQALDQGREVYAVPGSPFMDQTKGCHRMIQDGAKLVTDATDILDDWELIGKNFEAFNSSNKLN
ncbi:DNA-processing protein DprA [Oceanobacillus piezotolerans]|nr:DNA-processing protein DprA [Oceanobacillus piezotolerans]